MNQLITGLHHATAIAADPQQNLDFYAGILGLRLVKKTINFDAPEVYHLYYGNQEGAPGTIMTFFPYRGLRRGRKGKGQLTTTSFSVSSGALDYWMKRLKKFDIAFSQPWERLDREVFIYLEDPDGLGLELVANDHDQRAGYSYGQIPPEHAIKGFHTVTLSMEDYQPTADLLIQLLDHQLVVEKNDRLRFSLGGNPGNLVDIVFKTDDVPGLPGAGTVHHLAFATPDDKTQLEVQEKLLNAGYHVTQVLDRQYFHSIYFREPGGILFEVATNPPGFAKDETLEELGTKLMLPPWQENHRNKIAAGLAEINFNANKFYD
ncbi:MAG: ring-cleaving dioxygenase [Candidatus Cyclobacteriaceae bacterium M3_2C_046]